MRLERFDGPYETWFLKNGKQFTFGDTPLPDFMTGGSGDENLAVWTAMLESTTAPHEWAFDENTKKVAIRPMLFEPMTPDPQSSVVELPYRFVPALMSDNLNPHQNGMPRDADYRFALNFPLDRSVVTEAYTPGAFPENWAPEGVVVDRLATLPDKKELTIVAVIDDGLPFAHRHFRDDLKTRIEFCWLQSATARALAGTTLTDTVPIGRELSRGDINAALLRHNGDEDAVYRDPQMGAVSASMDLGANINKPFTHGAHVMDTACGFGPGDWTPGDDTDLLRVIGVQLPRNPLRDTSGFGKDIYILAAIHYIIARTKLLKQRYGADRVNLLINLSLGTTGGPHDGTHQLEAAIDELVEKRRTEDDGVTIVALPAANSFADRMHAIIQTADHDANGDVTLTWAIQPNDFTSSYVEIWLRHTQANCPAGAAALLEECQIEITSPSGQVSRRLASGGGNKIQFHKKIKSHRGAVIGQISLERYRSGNWRFVVCLAPTEFAGTAPDALVESGQWKIRLRRTASAQFSHIDAYIHRDEDPADTDNGARQSYFVDPAYRTHDNEGRAFGMAGVADDQIIRRHGSLNGWATHIDPLKPKTRIALAGFVGQPDGQSLLDAAPFTPAFYSSAGTADGAPPAIDFANHSDRSNLIAGVRAQGTRSGSTAYLMGTSAAAPQFIRQLALDLIVGLRTPASSSPSCFINVPGTKARLAKVYNQDGRREPPNPCLGLAANLKQSRPPPTV